MHRLSLVVVSRGYSLLSLVAVLGLLIAVSALGCGTSVVAAGGLSSFGSQA